MTTAVRPLQGTLPHGAQSTARPSRRAILTGAAIGIGAIGLGSAITAALAEAARPDPVRSVTAAYTSSGRREALDVETAQPLPAPSRRVPVASARVAAPVASSREPRVAS